MTRRACPSAASARATAVLVAVAGGLAGCADVQRAMEAPRVNPESPVAAEVAAGADRDYATPLLRDVPPVPRNLPLAGDVKTQVRSLVACRRAMAGYVAGHPPLSGQPAAFATDERAVAAIAEADAPPPDAAARAEAFAAQLRAQAAAPAPIGAGPAPIPQDAMPPAPFARAAPSRAHTPRAAARPRAPEGRAAAAPPPPEIAVAPAPAAPPLPAPLDDPLLARCT